MKIIYTISELSFKIIKRIVLNDINKIEIQCKKCHLSYEETVEVEI